MSAEILMVCHLPWVRELGGSRVQLELGEELERQGHGVDYLSIEKVLPLWMRRCGSTPPLAYFAERVGPYLQKAVARYKVIDAHQGTVLRDFHGDDAARLVVRSVGLVHWHRERAVGDGLTSHGGIAGTALRLIRSGRWRLDEWSADRSFQIADRVVAPNRDEFLYLRHNLSLGRKVSLVPLGMRDCMFRSLSRCNESPTRANASTVVNIASWLPVKGIRDWPKIVRHLQRLRPHTRFIFAGTGVSREVVMRDLDLAQDSSVAVVSSFGAGDLPAILDGCRAGAFPSHLEGFGLAVIEKLAAGIPVIAYDVPGPRDVLGQVDERLLVGKGDVRTFAERVTWVLNEEPAAYAGLSRRCREVASTYRWSRLAGDTLEVYYSDA